MYEPERGWIVVRTDSNGEVRSQQFHVERQCAEEALAKATQQGESTFLSREYTWGETRGLKNLRFCRCGGKRPTVHSIGRDRRWGEVPAGAQGTGKRR